MKTFRLPARPARLLPAAAFLLLSSCGGSDGPTAPDVDGLAMYVVTLDNRLLLIGSENPGTTVTEAPITGLAAGQRIVSIDFRPADGQLYGVGTDSRVYRINVNSAAATAIGPAFTPVLNGTHFGLAFNPVADRIRTSSVESDQNLRINPTDGTVTAADLNFAFAAGDVNAGDSPAVAALAYSNSTAGAATTVAYGIDSGNDVLVILSNPNNGTITTVGSLGVNTVPCSSFDIDARDGVGWVTLADLGISRLYTINLATGLATLVGVIDVDSEVQGLAIAPQ